MYKLSPKQYSFAYKIYLITVGMLITLLRTIIILLYRWHFWTSNNMLAINIEIENASFSENCHKYPGSLGKANSPFTVIFKDKYFDNYRKGTDPLG